MRNRILDLIENWEKKINVDLKYFIKNIPALITFTFISTLMSITSSIIFTRTVSQELYGVYVYIFTVFGTLSFFTVNGMNIAVQRASSRGYDGVLNESTRIRLKWSILGSVTIIALSFYYYFYAENLILAQCLLLSAFIFPFYYSLDLAQDFLSGKKMFKKYSYFKILISVITTLSSVFVLIMTKNILFALATNLIINSVTQIYIYIYTTRNVKTNNKTDDESISYGKNLTVQGLIPLVTSQIDTIFIANFLGFEQVAIFNIAVAAQSFSSIPRSIIQSLVFPKIAVMNKREGAKVLFKNLKFLIIVSIISCIILALLFPILIPLMFTKSYSDSIIIAQILLIAEIVASPGGIFTQMLKAQGRAGDLFRLSLYTRIISTALLFIFIPVLGVLGAVLVRIIYNLISTIYSVYIAKKS